MLPLRPGCRPGATLGAPGAVTAGLNRLPPVGLMLFSVGVADGDCDEVVVVVVVVDGDCPPLLLQPAVSTPIARSAAPPAAAIRRRVDR